MGYDDKVAERRVGPPSSRLRKGRPHDGGSTPSFAPQCGTPTYTKVSADKSEGQTAAPHPDSRAELATGQVWVESKGEGLGSTFAFAVPCVAPLGGTK